MREQDAVFLVSLPMMFVVYAFFSARHVSIMTQLQAPHPFQRLMEQCFPGPPPGFRAALGSYVAWTVFTQVTPLLVDLSETTDFVRAASASELVAALLWTGYLRTRPAT